MSMSRHSPPRSYSPEHPECDRPIKRQRNDSVTSFDQLQQQQRHGQFSGAPQANVASTSSTSGDTPSQGDLRRRQGKRPTLSCAECRRLKLKCDRTFPCASCTKRGCAQICPEGSLQSGRGSRFILANTSQLHEKIIQLSDRVKELEGGLGDLHTSVSNGAEHPLLHPDLLRIRTSTEPPPRDRSYRRDSTSAEDRHSNHGDDRQPSAHPDYPEQAGLTDAAISDAAGRASSSGTGWSVPSDLMALSSSFPMAWKLDLSIRKRIRDLLPIQEDCRKVCEIARRNALWQFTIDGSETFLTNLLHHVYTVPVASLCPRRLSLVLMLLAIGCAVDPSRPHDAPLGEAYYHLARASICEIPMFEEPNFDLLRSLFFMIWYMLTFSDNQKDVGYAFSLLGLLVKLSQTLGLHRDASRMKMIIPEELEQRRAFWWELLHLDCRLSLSLGRPPSLSLLHSDCKRPSYQDGTIYGSAEEAYYHEWKHDFLVTCMEPILQAVVSAKRPDYSAVLDLDQRVRDFDVPPVLRMTSNTSSPLFLVMQRMLVSTSRDIALLQLHRNPFKLALSAPQTFTLNHALAPSVLATYMSACSIISATQKMYEMEPELSCRFFGFWFNSFSAGMTLSLLAARAPASSLAPAALNEIDKLRNLWRHMGTALPCSCHALSALEKSAESSKKTYIQWRVDHAPVPVRQELPPAFSQAHADLKQSYGYIITIPHPLIEELPSFKSPSGSDANNGPDTVASCPSPDRLPSVYNFKPTLIRKSVEDLTAPKTSTQCTRVEDFTHSFKFDFGALSSGDHSFMAWF